MKTFFKSLKRQDGFTLVELMVVVAIIGLLSAVAIPNFRKYQAKAKMSEAKLQLSSVYTAETAFFSDYNIYHNCLVYMGYNPQREVLNRYYMVGIDTTAAINGAGLPTPSGAYGAAVTAGLSETDCPRTNATAFADNVTPTANLAAGVRIFNAGKGVGAIRANAVNYLPTTALGTMADQDTMTFTAGAGGVIDGDNTLNTEASQLTINEQKVFRVVRNGF